MAGVSTYNPSRVTCIVSGFPMTGYADGTFINVTMPNDGITSVVGADGEIARAVNSDRRCQVTITLQQTSQANTFLSGLFSSDVLTCGGVIGPILIQDLCGETLFMSSQCWVTKMPDMEFSKEITNRAWVLETGAPSVYLIGGNPAQ